MRDRDRLIIATAVFVCGTAFLARALWSSSKATPAGVPVGSQVAAERLAAAVGRGEVSSSRDQCSDSGRPDGTAPASPPSASDQLSAAIRGALVEGPPEAALSEQQREALAGVCVDRHRVLMSPSFEEYQALFERQVRAPFVIEGNPEDAAQAFLERAAPYKDGCQNVSDIRVACRFLNGKKWVMPEGQTIVIVNKRRFGPLVDPEEQRFPVYDVYIPWKIRDLKENAPLDAWWIMSYAWDAAASRWQPWAMSVNDPAARAQGLRGPWM